MSDGDKEWLFGLDSTVIFVVVWGPFIEPEATVRLKDPMRMSVEAGRPLILGQLRLIAGDRPQHAGADHWCG